MDLLYFVLSLASPRFYLYLWISVVAQWSLCFQAGWYLGGHQVTSDATNLRPYGCILLANVKSVMYRAFQPTIRSHYSREWNRGIFEHALDQVRFIRKCEDFYHKYFGIFMEDVKIRHCLLAFTDSPMVDIHTNGRSYAFDETVGYFKW